MRIVLVCSVVVAAFGLVGLAGCSNKAAQLDTASTVRYDPKTDESKLTGGPGGKPGSGKGKPKGDGGVPP